MICATCQPQEEIQPEPLANESASLPDKITKVGLGSDARLQELHSRLRTLAAPNSRQSTIQALMGFGELDLENMYRYADTNGPWVTYTIPLRMQEDQWHISERLVLAYRPTGYWGYILQLVSEDDQIPTCMGQLSGQVNILDLDRRLQSSTQFVDGVAQSAASKEGGTSDGREVYTDCDCQFVYEIKEVEIYNSRENGTVIETSEIAGIDCVYSGGGDSGSDGGSGGYGDGGGDMGTYLGPGDSDMDGGGGSGDNPVDDPDGLISLPEDRPVLLLDEEDLAERWESKHIKATTEFLADPCMAAAWNAVKESKAVYDVLKAFFGEVSNYSITFDIVESLPLGKNGGVVYGQCHPADATGNIRVEINKAAAVGTSYLQIASTIVHEAIHAELFRRRQEMINSGQEPECGEIEPTSFEDLWCYYLHYKIPADSENYQHEYIADHYIQTIANSLAEMHPKLSSLRFVDLMNKGLYALDGTRYDWSWQEFFEALAWQGLEETNEYKNVIENDNENIKKHKAYIEASQMEPNKCN